MQYTDLHKKFILRTVIFYLIAAGAGGVTAAIALLFVPQYSNSYAQYIGLTVVSLLFSLIPFIALPIQRALKQYAFSPNVTDQYLSNMSKSGAFYICPVILSVVVTVISIPPDQPGFYFYSVPIILAFTTTVLATATKAIVSFYSKKSGRAGDQI